MRPTVALLLVGLSACVEPPPRLALRWLHRTEARPAPPAVAADRVVVLLAEPGPSGGTLSSLEPTNGLAFEGPTAGAPISDRTPLADATGFVAATPLGKVVRHDYGLTLGFSAPAAGAYGKLAPLARGADGTVFGASTSGDVFALDPSSGAERFRVRLASGGAVATAPAPTADGGVVVASDLGDVVLLDAAGAVRFTALVDAPASGPSVLADGTIAVGDRASVRFFTPGGAPAGTRPRGARVVGTRPHGDGVLAYGEDGRLELLGPDGALRFSTETPDRTPIDARPVVVGDHFGVIDQLGHVLLVDGAGAVVDQLTLDAPILGDPVELGALEFVFVATPTGIRAIDFVAE